MACTGGVFLKGSRAWHPVATEVLLAEWRHDRSQIKVLPGQKGRTALRTKGQHAQRQPIFDMGNGKACHPLPVFKEFPLTRNLKGILGGSQEVCYPVAPLFSCCSFDELGSPAGPGAYTGECPHRATTGPLFHFHTCDSSRSFKLSLED